MFGVLKKKSCKDILILLLIGFVLASILFIVINTGKTAAILANGDDSAKRITFLAEYGWEVEQEPVEIRDVAIPLEFGDVYRNYNAIQLEQGCDLEAYRGKVVRRYSYAVLNYPNMDVPVRANLLLYEGNIIGGDICSLRLDGFMHGFTRPDTI